VRRPTISFASKCCLVLTYIVLAVPGGCTQSPIEEAASALENGQSLQMHPATRVVRLMRQSVGDTLDVWTGFDSLAYPFVAVKIYVNDGRMFSASLTRRALSGDWTMYSDYYYRRDSSLAAVISDLRTSHGDVRIVTRLLVDLSGNTIQKETSVFDLFSGKPVERRGMGKDPELFLSIRDWEKTIGRQYLVDSTRIGRGSE